MRARMCNCACWRHACGVWFCLSGALILCCQQTKHSLGLFKHIAASSLCVLSRCFTMMQRVRGLPVRGNAAMFMARAESLCSFRSHAIHHAGWEAHLASCGSASENGCFSSTSSSTKIKCQSSLDEGAIQSCSSQLGQQEMMHTSVPRLVTWGVGE